MRTVKPFVQADRAFVFSYLGIEDGPPWNDMPIIKLIRSLRDNAAWTPGELGQKLDSPVMGATILSMESACSQEGVERLLAALKPRLHEMAEAGWLNPTTFAVREECYEKVAAACRSLRESQGFTIAKLEQEMRARRLTGFAIAAFESRPSAGDRVGSIRSLASLLSIMDRLCEVFGIADKTMDGLSVLGRDGQPLIGKARPHKGR